MNSYQRQKAKKQKALIADLTPEEEKALCQAKVAPSLIYTEDQRRRIMETGEYAAAMKAYERDMKSIPALLADILKETTATRLILEDMWNSAK